MGPNGNSKGQPAIFVELALKNLPNPERIFLGLSFFFFIGEGRRTTTEHSLEVPIISHCRIPRQSEEKLHKNSFESEQDKSFRRNAALGVAVPEMPESCPEGLALRKKNLSRSGSIDPNA